MLHPVFAPCSSVPDHWRTPMRTPAPERAGRTGYAASSSARFALADGCGVELRVSWAEPPAAQHAAPQYVVIAGVLEPGGLRRAATGCAQGLVASFPTLVCLTPVDGQLVRGVSTRIRRGGVGACVLGGPSARPKDQLVLALVALLAGCGLRWNRVTAVCGSRQGSCALAVLKPSLEPRQ